MTTTQFNERLAALKAAEELAWMRRANALTHAQTFRTPKALDVFDDCAREWRDALRAVTDFTFSRMAVTEIPSQPFSVTISHGE